MELEKIYTTLCDTPSDINEHLPTLQRYASECEHVTEFGVRYGVSTYALLAGKPKKMFSYDIAPFDYMPVLVMALKDTDYTFIQGSTLEVEIEPTDLLFIDTLHNFDQLSRELELHGNKARKYIIFHDTTSYEYIGESYDGNLKEGIWRAIQEFMEANPEWTLHDRYYNNNGLTIIKKASV